MHRRLTAAFFGAALIAGPALSQWHLEAVMNGSNVVPAVSTTATGLGELTLNRPSNTLTYHVAVTGMTGTAAHLHLGVVGVNNGAVFQTLSGGPTVWQGTTAALTATDVVTLMNEGIYVDVHSAAFPNGQIRAQLVPVRRTYFTASLDQTQHVPPTGSAATGVGRIRLDEPRGRILYDLQTTGIVNPQAANLHIGVPGVNGSAIFNLSGGPTHWCGMSPVLSAANIAALKANGLYMHVHTNAFPNGEIRGQALQSVQPFSVTLDGAQENPPTGSAVAGCGRVDYDPATNTLSYAITHGALPSGTLFAHIHRGAIGLNGPIVFTLGPGPTSWTGTTGAVGGADLAELFEGNLYVNVHSMTFSGGEIRGQIRPDPYVFGFGGDGVSGKPRIDAAGYRGAAAPNVTFSLTNAQAGAGVLLLVGGSTTFAPFLGAPLPLGLPPLGVLWMDANPGFSVPLIADSTGCASITAPAPTDPALHCFKGYVQCVSTDASIAGNLVLSDALEIQILP